MPMKYWLGTLLRWSDQKTLNFYAVPNDVMVSFEEFMYGGKPQTKKVYYRFTEEGFQVANSAWFAEQHGLLPTSKEAKVLLAKPLPKRILGETSEALDLCRGYGGQFVPSSRSFYYDFIDREGNIWAALTGDDRYTLIQMADGLALPSEYSQKKHWKEGDVLQDASPLYQEGFRDGNKDPQTGIKVLVNDAKRVLFRHSADVGWLYHVIPPEAWNNPVGPYFTWDQMVIFSIANASLCKGSCKRYFNLEQLGACAHHRTCAECMEKEPHEHCKGCGSMLDNTLPATPEAVKKAFSGNWQVSPPTSLFAPGHELVNLSFESSLVKYGGNSYARRSCVTCNYCFKCVYECMWCPPDKGGRFKCASCCSGEHYEDESEENLSTYVRDYMDQHYPTAIPPFEAVVKCPACKGHGYTVATRAVGPVPCSPCHGNGVITSGRLWMGVELEVEVPTGLVAAAKAIVEKWSHMVILKRDSTIRHGFEVVTGPFSFEAHTEMWPELSRDLIKQGCRSWKYTNTGLHVHCNWEFLTMDQLCSYNVWLNNKGVKKQIVKIAGRENVYALLKPKRIDAAKGPQLRPHNEALNISTHRGKTFELRIFKGTLAVEHILADIQFVHASVNWIKEATYDQLDRWLPFWGYVLKRSDQYKELINHFDSHTTIEKFKEVA